MRRITRRPRGRPRSLARQRKAAIGFFWTFLALFLFVGPLDGGQKILKLATTTSTQSSGLLDLLLPAFEKETGIGVKVFAKGTGAALRDGMEGNVDVILVHAKSREEEFVAQGYGAYRLAVMHNDFVILGPESDPAGIRGEKDAVRALKRIAEAKARFVSRGDESGTHIKEQSLWASTGLALKRRTVVIMRKGKRETISQVHLADPGRWYLSIGQGMGKTLTYAEEKQAYTLADRATFLKYKFGRRLGLNLEILCQGDPRLHNPYGVIPISPRRHPHARFQWADRFARWLASPKAQALIAGYKIHGQQAFFPDAR